MDTHAGFVVQLHQAIELGDKLVGGKATNLSKLQHEGFKIPEGFCLTISAYESLLG